MSDMKKILTIPEGTEQINWWDLDLKGVTTLELPASLKTLPFFYSTARDLMEILVAEGNPVVKSIDGGLYSADGKILYFYPPAREGTLVIPEGVTEISSTALQTGRISSIVLPRSLEKLKSGTLAMDKLESITVAEGNPFFKVVDGVLYDITGTRLLCYPPTLGGDFRVPDRVTSVDMISAIVYKGEHLTFHMGPQVDTLTLPWDKTFVTVCAPEGSYAERYARRVGCNFVAEGEPVSPDDSDQRKERTLKEWRQNFTISTRSAGLNISKYLRSSKVVYLPDVMGKAEVATVDKYAFPADVALLCSKRLFLKLHPNNRNATIRSFLTDPALFTPEEKEYLLAYLKKNRAMYLELYIKNEDYDALGGCLEAMPKVKTLMEDCFQLTQQLNMPQVNFFLLQKAAEKQGGK